MTSRENALGSFATHPGGFCVDNAVDPGWCVYCGADMTPRPEPGDVPPPVADPAVVPVWYWERLRGIWGGDAS